MFNSYSHIHQIFYKNNKFDGEESIHRIESYCLNDDLIQDDTIVVIPPEPPKQIPLPDFEKPIKEEWFLPDKNDTIFWCIYTYINGQGEYNRIGHSYGNHALNEKQKIIEFIKKNPKLLKSSNVKLTNGNIQEILSEFMVDKTVSSFGIAALAIYYKIPIYMVNEEKKIYLKFLPELEYYEKTPCYLYLHKSERGKPKYKLYLNTTKPNIEDMICLESHLKPFKPASNYKMEDLNIIADKIGFILPNKIKKMELYEKLCELCGWIL
jgi:hypothetical protein